MLIPHPTAVDGETIAMKSVVASVNVDGKGPTAWNQNAPGIATTGASVSMASVFVMKASLGRIVGSRHVLTIAVIRADVSTVSVCALMVTPGTTAVRRFA